MAADVLGADFFAGTAFFAANSFAADFFGADFFAGTAFLAADVLGADFFAGTRAGIGLSAGACWFDTGRAVC